MNDYATWQPGDPLPWSLKTTPEFDLRLVQGCQALNPNQPLFPLWLMGCMAFESGETFSPSIRNAAGSGATGLIQFMPSTAEGLGTTTEELAQMSQLDQLEYVLDYFKPNAARIKSLSDCYMAILWPAAIGKPENYSLWSEDQAPITYRENAGLDTNDDRVITKAEAAGNVQKKLDKGWNFVRP